MQVAIYPTQRILWPTPDILWPIAEALWSTQIIWSIQEALWSTQETSVEAHCDNSDCMLTLCANDCYVPCFVGVDLISKNVFSNYLRILVSILIYSIRFYAVTIRNKSEKASYRNI